MVEKTLYHQNDIPCIPQTGLQAKPRHGPSRVQIWTEGNVLTVCQSRLNPVVYGILGFVTLFVGGAYA